MKHKRIHRRLLMMLMVNRCDTTRWLSSRVLRFKMQQISHTNLIIKAFRPNNTLVIYRPNSVTKAIMIRFKPPKIVSSPPRKWEWNWHWYRQSVVWKCHHNTSGNSGVKRRSCEKWDELKGERLPMPPPMRVSYVPSSTESCHRCLRSALLSIHCRCSWKLPRDVPSCTSLVC